MSCENYKGYAYSDATYSINYSCTVQCWRKPQCISTLLGHGLPQGVLIILQVHQKKSKAKYYLIYLLYKMVWNNHSIFTLYTIWTCLSGDFFKNIKEDRRFPHLWSWILLKRCTYLHPRGEAKLTREACKWSQIKWPSHTKPEEENGEPEHLKVTIIIEISILSIF